MTAALRTVITCSALLLMPPSAAAQIAARATYVGEGSFDLPPAGSTSPRDPAAIAVAPDGALHIVDQRGEVMVFWRVTHYQVEAPADAGSERLSVVRDLAVQHPSPVSRQDLDEPARTLAGHPASAVPQGIGPRQVEASSESRPELVEELESAFPCRRRRGRLFDQHPLDDLV